MTEERQHGKEERKRGWVCLEARSSGDEDDFSWGELGLIDFSGWGKYSMDRV